MSDVVLTTGGQRFSGWEKIRVSRGISQIAGSFRLRLTERFDGLHTVRPLRPGQTASVSVAGHPVIDGHIDVVAPDYDANHHSLHVSGRDATGDLVDCAAIHPSGSWHDRTLAQIAADLVKPFGITLKVLTDVGKPFKTWKIEPGETVMENLDRAARYRGVLLISDGLGNLLITQPATRQAPAGLTLGQNILRASGHSSELQRFEKYIVKAQQSGSDTVFGTAASAPSGEALDAAVGRYRPTVIMGESQSDAAECKARAEWQRTVSAARARQVVYTVTGWTANDQLWEPNALVHVTDSFLGIDEVRLISQVDFTLDEHGRRTELTVVGRHAFDRIALPEPNQGGLW